MRLNIKVANLRNGGLDGIVNSPGLNVFRNHAYLLKDIKCKTLLWFSNIRIQFLTLLYECRYMCIRENFITIFVACYIGTFRKWKM